MSTKSTKRQPPWQKRVYGNEAYADNYTDPSFLKDLQTNLNVKSFTVLEAICGASKLAHQISIICGFLLLFFNLYKEKIAPPTVLITSIAATIVGYILLYIKKYVDGQPVSNGTLCQDIQATLSVLAFGFILSPMLHTLTNSISTDTIYTVSLFVLLLHLLCYDYGLPASVVSSAISLNAVYFASISLASRLSTSLHAFTLLVVAIVMFALYPRFLSTITNKHNVATIIPLIPILCVNCFYLSLYSPSLFYVYVMAMFFINFVCPLLFCWLHKHKNNIHGPWDEAVVDVMEIDIKRKVL